MGQVIKELRKQIIQEVRHIDNVWILRTILQIIQNVQR